MFPQPLALAAQPLLEIALAQREAVEQVGAIDFRGPLQRRRRVLRRSPLRARQDPSRPCRPRTRPTPHPLPGTAPGAGSRRAADANCRGPEPPACPPTAAARSRSRDSRCPGAAASSASNATDFRAPSAISCPSGARNSNRPRRLTRQRSILVTATAARVRRTYRGRPYRFSGFFTSRQTSVNRSCATNVRATMRLHKEEGPSHEKADRIEKAAESRGARRRVRPRDAFLPGPCRAGERRRHRAGALRRAARHDEERPHARPERALHAARAGHPPDLRHPVDGPVVGRPVLGRSERGAAPAGDRELRALHLGDLCRPLRQLCRTETAGHRRAAQRRPASWSRARSSRPMASRSRSTT